MGFEFGGPDQRCVDFLRLAVSFASSNLFHRSLRPSTGSDLRSRGAVCDPFLAPVSCKAHGLIATVDLPRVFPDQDAGSGAGFPKAIGHMLPWIQSTGVSCCLRADERGVCLPSRAEECRAQAAECKGLARASKSDVRDSYRELARSWLDLAQHWYIGEIS